MRIATLAATLIVGASAAVSAVAWQAPNPSDANAWQIGPIIKSKNHSVGMPLHPTPDPRGWYFDFPYPSVGAGHVHYLTFNHGPLTGKKKIVIRYRIDAARGVRFLPREFPEQRPATISLYFQRRGDTWNAKGNYETYRWYAPLHTVVPIVPGEHSVTVSLQDTSWISVWGANAAARPDGFREAINEADRVGFVLGSREGRGHGVHATGPARMTVISFQVM